MKSEAGETFAWMTQHLINDASKKAMCMSSTGCSVLLIGSQITNIRAVKDALREASRIYVELHGLGAPMGYLDCGGGPGSTTTAARRTSTPR